jgi:hypothetical protein
MRKHAIVDTSAIQGGRLLWQMTDALAAACAETGMTATGARLLHVHSNTVLYLPASNAVARVTRARAARTGSRRR